MLAEKNTNQNWWPLWGWVAWVGWAKSWASEAAPESAVSGPIACLLAVRGPENGLVPFPAALPASVGWGHSFFLEAQSLGHSDIKQDCSPSGSSSSWTGSNTAQGAVDLLINFCRGSTAFIFISLPTCQFLLCSGFTPELSLGAGPHQVPALVF